MDKLASGVKQHERGEWKILLITILNDDNHLWTIVRYSTRIITRTVLFSEFWCNAFFLLWFLECFSVRDTPSFSFIVSKDVQCTSFLLVFSIEVQYYGLALNSIQYVHFVLKDVFYFFKVMITACLDCSKSNISRF